MDWLPCLLLASPCVLLYLIVLVLHAVSYFKELAFERELKKDILHFLVGFKNVNRSK